MAFLEADRQVSRDSAKGLGCGYRDWKGTWVDYLEVL